MFVGYICCLLLVAKCQLLSTVSLLSGVAVGDGYWVLVVMFGLLDNSWCLLV